MAEPPRNTEQSCYLYHIIVQPEKLSEKFEP